MSTRTRVVTGLAAVAAAFGLATVVAGPVIASAAASQESGNSVSAAPPTNGRIMAKLGH